MDTPEKPKRPWWRRKRTWAAVAFWLSLPVLYFAGFGPAHYGNARGWVPDPAFRMLYPPTWWSGDRRWWPDWYRTYAESWIIWTPPAANEAETHGPEKAATEGASD